MSFKKSNRKGRFKIGLVLSKSKLLARAYFLSGSGQVGVWITLCFTRDVKRVPIAAVSATLIPIAKEMHLPLANRSKIMKQ